MDSKNPTLVAVKVREAVKKKEKKKTGKLVTSAKKEGGGSGQNHDFRFL